MLEQVLKIAGVLLGGVTGVFTVFQWTAMRLRTKVKTDLEILEKLRAADKAQKEQGAKYTGEKDLSQEIVNITLHISKKMKEQYRDRSGDAEQLRYDPDASSLFTGLVLLYVCRLLWKFTLELQLNWTADDYKEWRFDLWIAIAVLLIAGLIMVIKGIWRPCRFIFSRELIPGRPTGIWKRARIALGWSS
jgi:hypothetical protein